MDSNDPVKKLLGKSAKEILSAKPEDHSKYHSNNAFCCHAGPEEMKHYYKLVGELSGEEIVSLAIKLGYVSKPAHDADNPLVRQSLEDMMIESDREDFYREFNNLKTKR